MRLDITQINNAIITISNADPEKGPKEKDFDIFEVMKALEYIGQVEKILFSYMPEGSEKKILKLQRDLVNSEEPFKTEYYKIIKNA